MDPRHGTLLLVLAACSPGGEIEIGGTEPPAAPAAGTPVPPGPALRDMLADPDGPDVLLLEPGAHDGPLTVERAVTIWGPREAVITSTGTGTTLAVDASDVRLLGFTVDGSGGRFDLLDAAIRVRAERVQVAGVAIRNALFGVLVEQSAHVSVRDCEVHGTGGAAMGLRGDGIRLWETTDSEVIGNVVTDCRDCVVWYSSRNRVVGNTVVRSRYGTHFMYSHENVVEQNRYLDDVVGVFVMYSHDVTIRRNLLARASGAAGVGLGVKESGNLTVEENDFVANSTGIYLDTSPLDIGHHNLFAQNRIRLSDTGIAFHASPSRNTFEGNDLRDNAHQVRVGGEGDALGITWSGNHFDDYQGYDLDGDGLGDVPYALRSLSSQLTMRYPDLAFFRGTPVLAVTDVVGHVAPVFAPRTVLEDPSPRMHGIESLLEAADAR